jgi:hypothetical protein
MLQLINGTEGSMETFDDTKSRIDVHMNIELLFMRGSRHEPIDIHFESHIEYPFRLSGKVNI